MGWPVGTDAQFGSLIPPGFAFGLGWLAWFGWARLRSARHFFRTVFSHRESTG
jgi:hypothetical protein